MQVQNNKEEVPFAHYEEKFASLDPQEAAMRCGVPFESGRFTVTLLGTAYQIAWPKYAISSEDEAAFALKNLPCQTFCCASCSKAARRSRPAAIRRSAKCRGARCISGRTPDGF